jgi:hypothetical protein
MEEYILEKITKKAIHKKAKESADEAKSKLKKKAKDEIKKIPETLADAGVSAIKKRIIKTFSTFNKPKNK